MSIMAGGCAMFLSESFEENVKTLNDIFENCDDVKCLDVELKYLNEIKGRIYFLEEAVSDIILRKVIYGLTDVQKVDTIEDMITGVMIGSAILIADGKNYALKIRGDGYPGIALLYMDTIVEKNC